MQGTTIIDRRLVLAPMSGGPGTVELAAAVHGAGGFAFLAGAYLSVDELKANIARLRELVGDAAFGVNLAVPVNAGAQSQQQAEQYAELVRPVAEAAGAELGAPTFSDDDFSAKLRLVVEERVPVVSFAFGWPSLEVVHTVGAVGIEAWATVNDASDAIRAEQQGFTGIIAQGWEAGGHRGGPEDDRQTPVTTMQLVRDVRARVELPIIAAGGVMDAASLQQLVDAGAVAVACGTAFLCSDEAGTSETHRKALGESRPSVVTKAFTGRFARGLANAWTDQFADAAPSAYPQVHFVTAPVRAHGARIGDPELLSLWAGTGASRAQSAPAADIAEDLLGRR